MAERAQLTAWMIAVADGERGAIEPLFRALWPICVGYAARLVGGDRALAEDCAQVALAKVFGQVDRFDGTRDALTWALTIVTWECRTARRTHARRGEIAGDAPPGAARADGEAIADGRAIAEDRDLIRAAVATLASLDRRDADAILVSLGDGPPLAAQLSPSALRKRIERAYTRLRAAWRSRHGTL